MLSVEDVKKFYEYFYFKKYGGKKYIYPTTSKDEKLIENFLSTLDKEYRLDSLGYNFLWKYFVFQFTYWDELTLQQVSKIQPNFILGKQAFYRYRDRDSEYDWQITNSKFITKYKVNESALIKIVEKPTSQVKQISITDRVFRAQHLNTEYGLAHCLEYTTLYDKRDISCLACKFKKECKELLKRNYPLLYSERGYGK